MIYGKTLRSILFMMFAAFIGMQFAENAYAEKKVISAEQFQWMTETSSNIQGRLKFYNNEIDKYDPYFYLDYDNVLTPGYEYKVPTPIGYWNVGPAEGNIGFYAGMKYAGIIGVVNGLNLLIDDKHKTGDYKKLNGWVNYNYIGGLRGAVNKDWQIIVGGMMKQYPCFVKDYKGDLLFAAYYDDDGVLQTNYNRIEAFIMLKIFGYDISTFYNKDDSKFSSFDIGGNVYSFEQLGTIYAGVKYFELDDTIQCEVKYTDILISDYLSLGTEGLFNAFTKSDEKGVIGHVVVYDKIYIVTDNPFDKNYDEPKDFYLAVKTGVSITKDNFDKNLYGGIIELSAENMQLLGSNTLFLIGGSYNYTETLTRMPVEDQFLISFKGRFLF